MALIDEVLGRIGWFREDRRTSVHHECRRCGKTVSNDESSCPVCGSSEIAEIPL